MIVTVAPDLSSVATPPRGIATCRALVHNYVEECQYPQTLTVPSSMPFCRTSSLLPLGTDRQAGRPLSKMSSISSSVLPFVSGAARNMWIKARPLNEANIIYIRQLMFHIRGGTAKARAQFQPQFEAVASETALARIWDGKISAGYVHDVGP